jgi:hypothetical protein
MLTTTIEESTIFKINYFLHLKAIIFCTTTKTQHMTILLLGSGGRACICLENDTKSTLRHPFVAPEMPELQLLQRVDMNLTFDAIKAFALKKKVEMVVVGPEDPLVKEFLILK